jgi:hypothetical protein
MTFRLLSLAALFLLSQVSAQATEDNPSLKGDALRIMVSGHTITGRHDDGMSYSEWHAPDGRVFGHNNRKPNDQACWDIRDNSVCYYYADGGRPRTSCWSYRKISDTGYRLILVRNGFGATGIWQAGNPHNHSDNSKTWTCEPLSSQNITPRMPGRNRHATLERMQ